MKMLWSWIVGFGRFWYDYIFGDDWTVAVAVFIGLAATAVLNSSHVVSFWLIPLIVFVMLGISLRRARPRDQGHAPPS
jgi:hypothetical protein